MTKPTTASLVLFFALVIGCGMVISGVYLLAGLGFALLTGSVPFLSLGAVLLRGMTYGG